VVKRRTGRTQSAGGAASVKKVGRGASTRTNGQHRRLGAESARVYELLRQKILAGDLEPGTRLSQRAVAQSVRTSNGPVISALRRLAHDGLIKYEHGHGGTVREFSDEQLQDLLTLRRALETEAARLAARRAGPEDLDRLYSIVRQMEQIVKKKNWSQADSSDVALHVAIARLARSPSLNEALSRCHMLEVVRRRLMSSQGQRDFPNLAANHRILVDAIASGDPDQAAQAMHVHLSRHLGRINSHS
jgi:DNA-binding GntR family transcriptional regulator